MIVFQVKAETTGVVMAGLGLFGQKSAIAVTMPIFTAFKFCIGHRKNGLLNR
jgi:hypothetical protein